MEKVFSVEENNNNFAADQYCLSFYIQLWYCKVKPRVCVGGHSAHLHLAHGLGAVAWPYPHGMRKPLSCEKRWECSSENLSVRTARFGLKFVEKAIL